MSSLSDNPKVVLSFRQTTWELIADCLASSKGEISKPGKAPGFISRERHRAADHIRKELKIMKEERAR